MKKITLLLFLAALAAGCQKCPENKPVDQQAAIKEIQTVLENYVIANETQQLELIHSIWAPSEDIVVIGTDQDEMLVGWTQIEAAIKKQFDNFEETYIAVTDQIIKVNETGNTGWFSEIVHYSFLYQGKPQSFEGIRFTGVINKSNGEWHIVQSHMSIPHQTKFNASGNNDSVESIISK